jgi:hypothetical protein
LLTRRQRTALADLPIRPLSGCFYRQTSPSRQPLDLPPQARRDARWHRAGDPQPAYAGDTELGAMLELPRHQPYDPSTPPILPRRRMSELHLEDLPVVDLANPLALEQLKLSRKTLTRGVGSEPEAEICRVIGDEVRSRARIDVIHGLLVPSAALPSGSTLVLFPAGFPKAIVGEQQIVELTVIRAPHLPQPDL